MVVTVFSGATTAPGDDRLDSRPPQADYSHDFFKTQPASQQSRRAKFRKIAL
jgi:hypothetical protein